jgi:5-methylcytosine-specific restriction endonuclease McrBC GTP-binding regulatory subunit McrB
VALNTLWQSQMDTQTESSDKQFVFIIDEINRGEISKIFGELFFSIEPGYRGEKGIVKTQYNNLIGDGDIFKNGFYVPENVYIIGTMNDIDRSVESMDFAMRRRFAWYEISADESADNMNLPEESKMRMKRLNEAISKIKGLNSSYFIGGAYFLNLNNCDGDYSQLWENHLKGLLAEYLRGMTDADKILNTLKEAYDNENPSVNDTDN